MAPSYTTNLFVPGDPEDKAFLGAVVTVADRLVNTFVIVTRDNVGATPVTSASAPVPDGVGAPRPVVAAEVRSRNLPRQLTSFVRRDPSALRGITRQKRL